jgi:catechol 2,3-dioxygenase-like lactoylglutathione lyase family enzyme
MALTAPVPGIRVSRLLRLRLCSAHAKSLADFYESALGFRRVAVEHLSGVRAQEHLAACGRVLRITLELGAQRVTLLQFVDQPGRAYPVDTDASDRIFQHFAIVVADMAAAIAQLSRVPGWTPITVGGPQQLPASSGGVIAFKFRDPEGHPLELLAFPAAHVPEYWRCIQSHSPFLGIDHSAICVADSARSVAFYGTLGLTVSHRSVNDDPAQARLDHLDRPVVEVTAMDAGQGTPHLELLCYRNANKSGVPDLRANDVAATCIVFEPDKRSPRPGAGRLSVQNLVDPDGHHLAIVWPDA